jgi:hypothetical protein
MELGRVRMLKTSGMKTGMKVIMLFPHKWDCGLFEHSVFLWRILVTLDN